MRRKHRMIQSGRRVDDRVILGYMSPTIDSGFVRNRLLDMFNDVFRWYHGFLCKHL